MANGDHLPRSLGAFREFGDGPTGAPSIREAVGGGPPPEIQRRIIFYLAQASSVRSTMGTQPDVLDGEPVFLSGGLQSDGDWYWRCDLAHYVAKYNISLPGDFIAHAERHLWNPGQLTPAEAQTCIERIRLQRQSSQD